MNRLSNQLRFYTTFTKSGMLKVTEPGCKCTDKPNIPQPNEEMGPLESSMYNKIVRDLSPTQLIIRNDSWKHAHHTGMENARNKAESHFHVTIVSDKFKDIRGTLARHRFIFKLLDEEIKGEGKIHGFQVVCKTPDEWIKLQEAKTAPRESSNAYFK